MTAIFRILGHDPTVHDVAAFGLDLPHPLDLLEDNGITDIHGSITRYSYSGSGTGSPVPEPSTLVLLSSGFVGLVVARRALRKRAGLAASGRK